MCMRNRDIAVIGMSGRFPGADSIPEFYVNLLNKKDCIRKVPKERLELTKQAKDKSYFELGYLEHIEEFDNDFFHISVREANLMDPQQRIALQEACKTIWNSGYSLETFRGSKTSIIMGCGDSGYTELTDESDGVVKIGNLKSVIAGRIAYHLDLKGLAYVLDTSCSSSLMAIHQGCNHLRNEESDYVLAGGISLTIQATEDELAKNNPLGIASQSYRTRAFDEQSDGTGGGEGCSFVLLKRLEDAIRDKDYIYAVIKGSSANQDGGASNSVAAPSPSSQTEVIVDAWKKAGVNPETITYIEAHGTGTKIGDPIEIQGLTDAYHQFTDKKGFCKISAVKTNIGHTGYHAGISSFIKAVLAIYHKKKLPLIHFQSPNPMIHFETSAVLPCTEVEEWKDEIRRAGISSFGLSGTNVHVVAEQAPEDFEKRKRDRVEGKKYPFILSATSEKGMKQYQEIYKAWLKDTPFAYEDIAYTQCIGRERLAYKKVFFASSKEELQEQLSMMEKPCYTKAKSEVVLLCSGDADTSANRLKENLTTWMSEESGIDDALLESALIKKSVRTVLGQIISYQQWKQLGVKMKTIVGCGAGNITVAYALGKLSLKEAIEKASTLDEPMSLNEEAFLAAMKKMAHNELVFVELGGKGILSAILSKKMIMSCVVCGNDDKNQVIANVVEAGINLDMKAFFSEHAHRIPIPPYPFEKKCCWIERVVEKKVENIEETGDHALSQQQSTKELIREIWEEVLGVSSFTDEEDFYNIGGNSLMAMQIIDRIVEYRGVELEFDDLYTYNTVVKLAEYIDSQTSREEVAAKYETEKVFKKEKVLSYQQQSMLVIYKQNKKSTAYNMPAMIRLKGQLDKQALFDAMNCIVQKHEVLRTVYKEENGMYQIHIKEEVVLPFVFADLSEVDEKERVIQQKKEEMLGTTFDLEEEIPIKMELIQLDKEEYLLNMVLHHIAADGWSVGIIFKELKEYYKERKQGNEVIVLPNEMDYGDYAIKNKQLLETQQGKEKLNYWLQSLDNNSAYLEFPIDKVRPEIMMNYGDNFVFEFSNKMKQMMDEFCKKYNITNYVLLYSAYCILLYRYSGQSDFCIGSPVANRRGLQEEKIVGFFANTLAIRERIDGTQSFLEYVQANKNKLAEALRNQEIPLEYIVKNLKINRSASHSPVFQYGFVLQNLGNEFSLDGLKAEFLDLSQHYSKFEMLMSLSLSQTEFTGRIEYSTELFEEESICKFAECYQILLENCLKSPELSLDEMIITKEISVEAVENDDYDF